MMSDKPLPTDLELTALDPIFREHPHDRLDRLRTEDPAYLDAALGRLFLTRFEDIRAVLADRSLSRDPRKAPSTGTNYSKADPKAKMHESLSLWWRPAEILPKRHWNWRQRRDERRMNLARRRTIPAAGTGGGRPARCVGCGDPEKSLSDNRS